MLNLKAELNDRQYTAASTIQGPLLIIAGAGSGKTRVITFRIAHMLEQKIPQSAILALTFTNKAAREMEERVKELTQRKLPNLTVSTFHAFGVSILRKEIHRLGYRDNFSIYDTVDQKALIKESARLLHYTSDTLDMNVVLPLFSGIKTGRVKWCRENDMYEPLFHEYEDHLKTYNAVDFDDLIRLPIKILEDFPDVLAAYQDRFRYIMVDEFQDTSMLQYKFMHLLASGSRNICVVGDDDQSIYSWRGANYGNILQFEKDFPELLEVKLEQNYRSTGTILEAANSLIANNTNRKDKALWTGSDTGSSIEIYYPEDDRKEAEFISEMIKTISIKEGAKYDQFGVLIRTNSLAATLEEAFLKENIPYTVSGGTSFFQRKEVKDLISYIRLMANPNDDVSFLRVVNTPRRGIGKTTLQTLSKIADSNESSLMDAISLSRHAEDSPITAKIQAELDGFEILLTEYRNKLKTGQKMADTMKEFLEAIDIWGYLLLDNQKSEKAARWKYHNMEIFIDMLRRWEIDQLKNEKRPNIYNFLNRISLITRDDNEEEDKGKVALMTIHAAKGLEHDIVFLMGVEENIIPHARSVEEDPANIEEERRLFYVAITRARKRLIMTACKIRKMMKETIECKPSPFLNEIPTKLMDFRTENNENFTEEEGIDILAALKDRFKPAEESK